MCQWRTLRKAADETAGGGAPVLIALLPPSALGRAHLTPVSPVHGSCPEAAASAGFSGSNPKSQEAPRKTGAAGTLSSQESLLLNRLDG